MEIEPKNPEKIRILVPEKEIKDDFGFADNIEDDFKIDDICFIAYKNPENISNEEYFDKICREKLTEKYGSELSREILERYEEEKNTIISLGYCDMFLHYADVIDWSKRNNIMLGTGRGSAVGSLICYILGITKVDPLKYNLLFERFINKERICKPDIELDVAEKDRGKLTEYIYEKFGEEYCATGYEMSYPINYANKELFLKTNIYIFDKPIKEYIPLAKLTEDIFLSLKSVSSFERFFCLTFKFHASYTLEKIKKSGINTDKIPTDNKNVFALLKQNKELQSDSDIFEKINPSSIEEIAAVYQLSRCAVINSGITERYIKEKNSDIKEYYCELITPILKETYGEILWNEQIMQILNIIGGFPLSEADLIRRSMAKKDGIAKNYEKDFIYNSLSKGLEYPKAKELWDRMNDISCYSYLKAHAISTVLTIYYETYLQAQENITEQITIKTGFYELDRLTGGLKNGELVVIAGRPSMGKTALALNLALNVLKNKEKTVAIFSLEMSKSQILKRIIASECRIEPNSLYSENVDINTIEECSRCLENLSEKKLFIDDSPKITPEFIRKQCQNLAESRNTPNLVIIDYLQLMESDKSENDRTAIINDIIKDLKHLARELNIPIVLLSQLSRAVEWREDKHPLLVDLRDSSSIENADMIIFLYRNNYYNAEADNEAELIVAKNRNGDTGTAKLHFYKEFVKFV